MQLPHINGRNSYLTENSVLPLEDRSFDAVCGNNRFYRRNKTRNKQMQFSVLIKIQLDATVCRYLFTAKSLYMFRVSQHPSSGVLKTVTAASGTDHNIGTATFLERGQVGQSRSCHVGGK